MTSPIYQGLRNLDHDPELAKALGNMVIAWASADQALIAVLSTVTGLSWKMAAAAYHRMPTFESRTKVISALICEWETTEYDKSAMTRAIVKLKLLARKRNRWIHNSWGATPSALWGFEKVSPPMPAETVTFNYREEANSPGRVQPVKTHDVLQHNEAVNRRYDELIMLTRRSSVGSFPLEPSNNTDRY